MHCRSLRGTLGVFPSHFCPRRKTTALAAVAAVEVRKNGVKKLRGKVMGCVAVGAVKSTGPTDRDQSATGPTFLTAA